MENLIKSTLSRIGRFEAKIDLITLEAGEKHQRIYDLEFLEKVFEGGFYSDPNHRPSDDRNYGDKLIKELPGFHVNLFIDPLSRRLPPLRIEICPRDGITNTAYKDFLIWLDQKVPDLRVCSVEYTIDQYCYSPRNVYVLFRIEKRFLYFPYITPSKSADYKSVGAFRNDKRTRINRTFYFDSKRTTKIYERGNDVKDGDGWVFESLDRVRLEYTARDKALTDKGIKVLRDFIKNPRFPFHFLFRRFKSDSPFPVDGDFTEILYRQHDIWKKGKAEKPSQYFEDVEELEPLKLNLMNSMAAFQTEWDGFR
jgi:hypothetical protein